MVNKPKTPEKNPTHGVQHISDTCSRGTQVVPTIAMKNPTNMIAIARR